MRRHLTRLAFCATLLWAAAGWAQEPQVRVTVEDTGVMVGQPVLVQVEVLVPTFMPRAPTFPTFEMPGLLVRLPERSTVPVSERVDGGTWSGVRRTYRIYPMRAGVTEVPPQRIDIVYKDVDSNDDVPLSLDVPAMEITAYVPPAARTLDPLLLAQDVTVEQVWSGVETTMEVGDAVTRQLRVSVTGTSALFVPALLDTALPKANPPPDDPASSIATLAPYPEDAVVTESFENGVMSGTRSEQVSYIAQTGGEARFPDITLSWFNVDTGEVEDILLPGQSVAVAMPPRTRPSFDRAAAMRAASVLILAALLVWAAHRWLWPVLKARAQAVRIRYDGTAHAAHRAAEDRARQLDLNGLLDALALRGKRGRVPGAALQSSLDALTRALYRDGAARSEAGGHWVAVQRAIRQERPPLVPRRGAGRGRDALPSLNP